VRQPVAIEWDAEAADRKLPLPAAVDEEGQGLVAH
jgi:hypothetical protein